MAASNTTVRPFGLAVWWTEQKSFCGVIRGKNGCEEEQWIQTNLKKNFAVKRRDGRTWEYIKASSWEAEKNECK